MTQAPVDASGVSNRSPAVEFLAALFNGTSDESDGQVYLSSLPNERDDPLEPTGEKHVCPPTGEAVDKFISKWDRPRRGLFVCVSTVADNRRNKDNARETVCLHADVDFKNLDCDEPTIRAALATLPTPPSIVIRSGNGLHLYWLLREVVETQRIRDRLEAALRQLANVCGGDPAVAEVSRLMRLPGTHNTKKGDWREVVIERCEPELRYELEDLEDWLDEQRAVLVRKDKIGTGQVSARSYPSEQTGNDNPWLAAAEKWGVKLRLDVDALLAEMGDGNINTSLFRAVGSMTRDGRDEEEIVATLMEASRKVGGADWDWRKQEKEIRDMCVRTRRNFLKEQDVSREAIGNENVVNFDNAKERHGPTKPKPKVGSSNASRVPFAVADGVIDTLRRRRADILLSEGEVWLYSDGFWRIMNSADHQWLLTLIQQGFETWEELAKLSALALAWKRIIEHPKLFQAKVPWASGDMIVCKNGVFRIETGHFEGHRPENYARRHIGTEYQAGADCPRFKHLIADMFCDRADADVVIGLVQEWAGAALAIARMTREERRALILVGPSRTGKTELAKIFALLFGDPIATPSVAEISDPKFGLSPFLGVTAWVRDDAINEGDKLDPQRFKTIVTGEPIDIQKKRKDIVSGVQLNIPVLLTANTLPRARDGSDAIFNRSIILTMSNVISEAAAYQARLGIGSNSGLSIGAAIFEYEGPGILNWALEGLRRLMERGFYDIPDSIAAAIQQFKDDNNPVGEWAREAVEADPWSKIERRDLVRSYNGWELELEGDEAHAHGGRWLLPRLRSQVKGLGAVQGHGGRRYITGVKLTALGLAMWESYGKASPRNGPGGFALTLAEVNQIYEGDERGAHSKPRIEDTF